MHSRHIALLCATLALVACDDDPSGPSSPITFIRVVNASPATQSYDLLVDGDVAVTGIAFGTATTNCVRVDAGARAISLRSAGQTIATVNATLATTEEYMLLLTGTQAATRTASLVDRGVTIRPGAGRMFVRVANATGHDGVVFVSEPTAALPNIPRFITQANDVTSFADTPAAETRARFFAGNQTPPPGPLVADLAVGALPPSGMGTLVITGPVVGTQGTGFFVPNCS